MFLLALALGLVIGMIIQWKRTQVKLYDLKGTVYSLQEERKELLRNQKPPYKKPKKAPACVEQVRKLNSILSRDGMQHVDLKIFELAAKVDDQTTYFRLHDDGQWVRINPPKPQIVVANPEPQNQKEEATKEESGPEESAETWFETNQEYLDRLAPKGTSSFIVPMKMLDGISDPVKQEITRNFMLIYGAQDAELKDDGIHVVVPSITEITE